MRREVGRSDGGDIRARPHESRMTERELPGESVDEIQARRHRDVDADEHQDGKIIRVKAAHEGRKTRKGCDDDNEYEWWSHEVIQAVLFF